MSEKLTISYYQHNDVVELSRDLIGKKIVSNINGELTSGIITETEAYRGYDDKACHSHLGRFTDRTKVMYEPGGVAYVYLCYGIHHLFNIITNTDGNADAILIRAVEPVEGIDIMLKRRGKKKLDKTLTSGPGNFSKAFALDKSFYGADLTGDEVWIEKSDLFRFRESDIISTTRIGIDYADEDKNLPWRFYLNTSDYISRR
ncbi:DNA-3-methyladenine glycosylase [Nonlabens ulvanivorans]|uniref:Putative 3-methyladenine DNA glycosylase n=1 Tax=Nonlabens ulvanivorans TaxID=906888 RepID=A0A084JXD0_NONUL|nr:DNA-3-methyladenine glycosylase [Nonlabens ulvanivorans]KEZ93614.1 3-methyladenine DNA glycosylase [Nonlabens ulvanivorans]PRX14200.1 DNA-3-methyladenine glycosylase [Nonlabens ulvanivorans]